MKGIRFTPEDLREVEECMHISKQSFSEYVRAAIFERNKLVRREQRLELLTDAAIDGKLDGLVDEIKDHISSRLDKDS
tara:strand:+ start:370 stop:603 length:234 start_codon:yes stop_codon:yes gene_type:complete